STGAVQIAYRTTSGTNITLNTDTGLVPVGQFTHVAATIDPDAGLMKVFLNGTEVASRATAGPLFADATAFEIGHSDPGQGRFYFFNGLIDEPAVYNRALIAAEIQSLYLAGAAGQDTLASNTITATNATP